MPSTERSTLAKVGGVALWILIVLEMLGMGLAGASKFQGDGWVRMFEGWGYAAWFAYLIGAAELVGALLLLAPRVASYSGMLLIAIMLGAIYTVTTATTETGLGPGIPTIHIVVLIIIVVARWGRRWGGGDAPTARGRTAAP